MAEQLQHHPSEQPGLAQETEPAHFDAPPAAPINDRTGDAPRETTLLARVARFLTHLPNTDALLQVALDDSMAELQAVRGLVCMLDPATGILRVAHTAGEGWQDAPDLSSLEVKDEPGGGITGHVAATARAYYAPDVTVDPYYISHWQDARCELAVPFLDTNGNAIGVLVVESDRVAAFSPEDRQFVQAYAEAIAAALIVADYRDREKALIEIGKELSTIVNTGDLMQRVVNTGAGLLRAQDCTLLLLADDRAHVTLAASYGPLKERVGQAMYRVGEGLTGWVAEYGQPVRVRDVREDPRWKGLHVEMPPEGIGAFMAVPVLGSKGALGVLRVVRRKRKYIGISQEFTESDQDLLLTLASQVGVAIENCQLLDRAIRSERMATWGEMSARAAHMIGNRVFAIKGSLNELKHILSTSHNLPGEIPELVVDVDRGITRLEEILREFRDFVVATKLDTSLQDINALVREVVEESCPRDRRARILMDLEPDAPPILADPLRLRRALSELVENALDFLPAGGAIQLSTSVLPASAPRDAASGLPSGELVLITIRDSGPGVPPELKQRIFHPFFSTRAKGMGLGLSIVSGIIESHRGVIREVGVPGQGAEFEIYLPSARQNKHRSSSRSN